MRDVIGPFVATFDPVRAPVRMTDVTEMSPQTPEPLAALPLLAEAGVSVYWVPLEGRTAWVADADSRTVWISRAVPRDALLGCLVDALRVVDDGPGPAPSLRLVHRVDDVEPAPDAGAPSLRLVPDA